MKKYFFILFTILFYCCNDKDDNPIPSDFIVGSISDNSYYKTFEPPSENLVSYNQNPDEQTGGQYLDVDNDGVYDFLIENRYGFQSKATTMSTGIEVVNPVFEMAFVIKQYIQFHYYYVIGDSAYIAYYTADKVPVSIGTQYDRIFQERFYIQPAIFESGPIFNDTINWDNGYLEIASKFTGKIISSEEARVFIYDMETGQNWTKGVPKTVLFRMIEEDLVYYGWISIELIDANGFKIYEIYFDKTGYLN